MERLLSEIRGVGFLGWINATYRVALLLVLAVIAWQQSRQLHAIASISSPEVQDVRVVNDDNDKIPVDAVVETKQESISVRIVNNGFLDAVPVRVEQ